MIKTILGRTNLEICKDAFGALPIQRASMEDAVKILQKALDGGINFFDTARGYTDSEEKIGKALSSRRKEFYIATKSNPGSVKEFEDNLNTSLKNLKTDYIDLFQVHNPTYLPRPGDEKGVYDAAVKARESGKIGNIGISFHKLPMAKEAVESGLYDTIQFPFSYLSNDEEIAFTKLCKEKNVGFIAMKALSGGLITDIYAARAWMCRHSNVVPIWGIQRETEIDQLLDAISKEPVITKEYEERIAKDRSELLGDFCRGCGYCLPCPADIPINLAARISHLMMRSVTERFLEKEWQDTMARVENCTQCGHCKANCPYELEPTVLLEKNYKWYKDYLKEHL